jgi:DNA-binding MarR family transcriptional regulator
MTKKSLVRFFTEKFMHKHEMTTILFELKSELENNKEIEAHQRQTMAALAEEISIRVNDPQESMSGDKFLLTKLKEITEEFEIAHPKMTNIVGRLSDLLARMGI